MTVQLGRSDVDGGPAVAKEPMWGTKGWTPAHTEAVVVLGECVAVGAVVGFLTELARLTGERHARR
ncbi:hypothetical protein [Blastococcus sp. SYSU D01042]